MVSIIVPVRHFYYWGSPSVPPELRPIEVFYQMFDPKTGTRRCVKWYYDQRKDSTLTRVIEGETFYAYGTDDGNGFIPLESK